VGVGDDQLHAGQAAGDQAPQERQPAGPVLARSHLEPEDLPMPVGVHAGGDQGVHVDHPPVLADLHPQRINPAERVRPGIQRPVAERGDLGIEMAGHLRHLRARQRLDAQLLSQLLHPPGGHPEQIGGGHHGDQGLFGAAAVGQQPFREVAALAQLGHRELDRARAGVPLAGPVAVAAVAALGAAFAVVGAAELIGLRGHQRVGHHGHHLPQHIG